MEEKHLYIPVHYNEDLFCFEVKSLFSFYPFDMRGYDYIEEYVCCTFEGTIEETIKMKVFKRYSTYWVKLKDILA